MHSYEGSPVNWLVTLDSLHWLTFTEDLVAMHLGLTAISRHTVFIKTMLIDCPYLGHFTELLVFY